jgi:DNA-binding NarL/FixJ family response regulator
MKALLVDDHALLRDGLALMMEQEFPALKLLQAGNLAEARSAVRDHPDIRLVLLDLGLPDGHGIDALPMLREEAPGATLVVLSADDSPDTVIAAINAGAAGFIPKTANSGAMVDALRIVLSGGVHVPASLLDAQGSQRLANAAASAARPLSPSDLGLSPRQAEVLRLLIDGKRNKQISRQLDMSESTVKTHLEAIFRKLEVNTRTQAVVAAARLGLRFGPPTAD